MHLLYSGKAVFYKIKEFPENLFIFDFKGFFPLHSGRKMIAKI